MENAKVNYDRMFEETVSSLPQGDKRPRLLLHVCCAPCSSAVLERVSTYFRVTVFYDNPNITGGAEFRKRADEVKRLISEMPCCGGVSYREGAYEPDVFFRAVQGHEADPEGGERCRICFALRLLRTAREAKAGGFDYFTTTLTISPLKDAQALNAAGFRAAEETGVSFLPSDFKKKDGFRRSVELSGIYGLYRQDYCGCIFSKQKTGDKIGAL